VSTPAAPITVSTVSTGTAAIADTAPAAELPLLLAGPVVRRLESQRLVLWVATARPVRCRLRLEAPDGTIDLAPGADQGAILQAGERLFHHLIDLALPRALPEGQWVGYRLLAEEAGETIDLTGPDSGLCYPGRDSPGVVFQPRVRALLHGSCRKPHHTGGGDGLAEADARLAGLLARDEPWPALLVLSGDQIYADDVAGPMLRAIHALIPRLGLPAEPLPAAELTGLADSAALYRHPRGYYRRETLLPRHAANAGLIDLLFGGVAKPVFTTDSAHNHLITLAEVLAMYLLVWSPVPWAGLDLSPPPGLRPAEARRYARERAAIESFVGGLGAARRLLAHLPVAMIFDDHDITDDWNLSAEWEQVAQAHPFSRRVIGNALLGYLIHQGWGNRPEAFPPDLLAAAQRALAAPGSPAHDDCLERLRRFDQWHYVWPTAPALVVLDSRTHRWHSEVSPRQPSGLMDWEGLTDLQQALVGRESVLLVSSAPIFGVKLIETLQHVFSWLGRPLMVDAENWMGHAGAATAILNIFRHPRTPKHFVVLSGDVHYSFVYDVRLRPRRVHRGPGPAIWQVCSSGLRNAFPDRLLAALDHLNRWLYAPRSPLNWFTRRRAMRVVPRKPVGTPHGRRLLNGAGVGWVALDDEGRPVRIEQWLAGGDAIAFVPREAEARWD